MWWKFLPKSKHWHKQKWVASMSILLVTLHPLGHTSLQRITFQLAEDTELYLCVLTLRLTSALHSPFYKFRSVTVWKLCTSTDLHIAANSMSQCGSLSSVKLNYRLEFWRWLQLFCLSRWFKFLSNDGWGVWRTVWDFVEVLRSLTVNTICKLKYNTNFVTNGFIYLTSFKTNTI